MATCPECWMQNCPGHGGSGSPGSKLVHCVDSGTTCVSGGNMGGSKRSANAYSKCPTCGKTVRVTQDGRLWPHGTRKPVTP